MSLKWETPPPDKRSGGPRSTKWADIAAELRDRPGEWALVGEALSPSFATNLRQGRSPGWTPGEFEIRTTATSSRNRVAIYARFVGVS